MINHDCQGGNKERWGKKHSLKTRFVQIFKENIKKKNDVVHQRELEEAKKYKNWKAAYVVQHKDV